MDVEHLKWKIVQLKSPGDGPNQSTYHAQKIVIKGLDYDHL